MAPSSLPFSPPFTTALLDITRLVNIVERDQRKMLPSEENRPLSNKQSRASTQALIAATHTSYVGPGSIRPEGPRHDNDSEDINNIRVAPTHEELMSRVPPYLPVNLYDAPHHLPTESMQRLLDIQFRLLREELM